MTTAHNEQGPDPRQLAENITVLRHRAGLSDKQVALATGITPQTYSRRVNGSPWLFWEVQAIAEFFGVTLDEITTALPTREEWEGRRAVHPLGLEPRTR